MAKTLSLSMVVLGLLFVLSSAFAQYYPPLEPSAPPEPQTLEELGLVGPLERAIFFRVLYGQREIESAHRFNDEGVEWERLEHGTTWRWHHDGIPFERQEGATRWRFVYDDSGQLASVVRTEPTGTFLEERFAYDSQGRLSEWRMFAPDGSVRRALHYVYESGTDERGDFTRRLTFEGDREVYTLTRYYDAVGRLVREHRIYEETRGGTLQNNMLYRPESTTTYTYHGENHAESYLKCRGHGSGNTCFDKAGRMTYDYDSGLRGFTESHYRYDDEGRLALRSVRSRCMICYDYVRYTDYETDAHGNWLRRSVFEAEYNAEDGSPQPPADLEFSFQGVEERELTLEYYP